jgi:hypothetical protein
MNKKKIRFELWIMDGQFYWSVFHPKSEVTSSGYRRQSDCRKALNKFIKTISDGDYEIVNSQ